MTEPAALVRQYLTLLETCNPDPAAYAELLHPEAPSHEHPALLARTTRLAAQSFDLQHLHTCANDTVVVEAQWQGETSFPVPGFGPNRQLSAQVCLVFELFDGKIYRQQRYGDLLG
jgi:hypothetical protein